MHASIDHLLSLRDGQPVDAATVAHVDQCARCLAELRKLRETQVKLQSLPQLDAPSSFQEIQRAMARPANAPRRIVSARLVAALAFVTLTAIFFVALRDGTRTPVAEHKPVEQQTPAIDIIETARVPELVARSQQLEDLLQKLPDRPRIERVSTAAMIDTIEDRIQWLDFQLSDARDSGLNEEQTRRLWRERVELMDSLVKVRYAEAEFPSDRSILMNNRSKVFASLIVAALLAVAANAGAAEPDSKAADAKSADNDAKLQAERERKLADARRRLDEAAREVANLSISMSDDMVPHMRTFGRVMGGPPRAVLGINLGTNDDVKGGGVEVVSVSPGGAAERAGLKAGDVLTEINGKALKSSDDESAREQLLSSMRKVKPGDTVALSYRRDNKVVKANLVAQPLQDHFFTMAVPPGPPGMGPMPRMPNFVFMRGEGVFGSAELVPLTPKLGQYFGTQTGLWWYARPRTAA
jgi:hypothetical protein